MGYNARNDEIRDNVTRMRREWRFKTTIIVLDHSPSLQTVNVRYFPASNYKDEKSKL
jgi:hypothetical protein